MIILQRRFYPHFTVEETVSEIPNNFFNVSKLNYDPRSIHFEITYAWVTHKIWGISLAISATPNIFSTKYQFCERQFFHGPRVRVGWLRDDSSPLHLLCALFLLLLHQLHLRASGIRPQRLRTPTSTYGSWFLLGLVSLYTFQKYSVYLSRGTKCFLFRSFHIFLFTLCLAKTN